MLQMDASVHFWFGEGKSQLHIAVDDATGAIVGAYFDSQETLNGYYNVLHQMLNNTGFHTCFLLIDVLYLSINRKNPLLLKRILSPNLVMLVTN